VRFRRTDTEGVEHEHLKGYTFCAFVARSIMRKRLKSALAAGRSGDRPGDDFDVSLDEVRLLLSL
jgi:hypothetical protein